MPRFWKLLVLAALCLSFLLAVRPTTSPVSSSDAAAAVVRVAPPDARVKTAPAPPSPAPAKGPLPLQKGLQELLLEPPEWHPPTLGMLLDSAPTARTRAPLSARLPRTTRLDLDTPSGNYATLRPQQLGEAYQAGARLQGTMFTVLRQGYSLSLQQQNVALVPMSFDLARGEFALHAESAGHYLIVLHLSNPQNTSYVFHNKLQRLEFEQHVVPVVTTLAEQDEAVQSGASFVVPCLLQLDADEWASLYWYMRGGSVLFHALTVDKVG